MKRIFLSLLTCSICLSAFAQIDTPKKPNPGESDKWEIIKGSPKAIKSKLFVSLPADAHWDMTIYAAGSKKVLSNTLLKKEFSLLPGSYDVEINKIRITGVPVEKGNNTRIKAGVLHITTPDAWTLYDETHQTVLINTYAEQKRGLPVGKYILSINNQVQAIEIKDEHQVDTGFVESPLYKITPLEGMPSANIGKLSIKIPKDTTIYIVDKWVTLPLNIRDTVKHKAAYSSSYTIINLPKYFTAGTYNISLNNIKFSVPVKTGKETRIKAGFLVITKKETDGGGFDGYVADQLMGSDDITWEWRLKRGETTVATGKKRKIFALPPGEYELKRYDPSDYGPGGNHIYYKVIIKDGEWVVNGVKQ